MARIRELELEPYGATVGLDLGYRWSSGFRLGAHFGYGFGRSVTQRRTLLGGDEYDMTADASSVTGAISFAYDVPLYALMLRYSLDLGAMSMSRDLGGIPPRSFFDEEDFESPNVGFYAAPGAALFWQRGPLEIGVGFDYLVQVNDAIPNGFVGKLLTGAKW
jgi:hypothetical protein